jgi:murein DD-endopeptidase MepM/ murein hydrolase activator NlpD
VRFLLFFGALACAAGCELKPDSPKQGDAIRVTCAADIVSARMDGKTITLFPQDGGARFGLMPVKVNETAGTHKLEFLNGAGSVAQSREIAVQNAHFPSQNVVLGKELVELKPSPDEEERVGKFRDTVSPERHWSDPLIAPVPGCITSLYGVRRLHNGKPTGGYHTGLDQRTPAGEPIRAVAGGTVRLAGHFNLHGNTVGVDHGQGLESIYLHMSRFAVKEGDVVRQGDIVGYAGSTGRSTAPHLHWNLFANGVGVNPLQWVKLEPCVKPKAK